MIRCFVLSMVSMLLCASCTAMHTSSLPDATAQIYLASMHERLALSQSQMSVFQMAGQAAARRAIAGGYVWVGGSQQDFASEAISRAGGLVRARRLDLSQVFRRDVVLYAARGALLPVDLRAIARCKSAGAYVIAFASAEGTVRNPDGPDVLLDSGDSAGLNTGRGICPLDTVTNIVNLWAWTGEFTSACTRLGKMPVINQNDGLEGGTERNARYAGQMFHYDLSVAAVSPGLLGTEYLHRVNQMLNRIEHDDLDELTQAGRWINAAEPKDLGAQFTSHLYPDHFRDSRAPQPIKAMVSGTETAPHKPILITIGYQHPPQDLIDAARRQHKRLFYCSVLRRRGGLAENILYANPHWPMDDGCVTVPGYDIPLLLASGVVQATVYWSIVAEAYRGR